MQQLLRLLSDPTRLRILAAVEPEELAVNEIADVLGMSQSRISNHLRLLKDGDALRGRRDGVWTFYRNALGDHPDGAELWQAVRDGIETEAAFREDRERRRAVLERRRRRSREHFAAGNGKNGVVLERGSLRAEILAALAPRELIAVDAGCGDGFLTEVLAERFDTVLAFDHSSQRLAAARRRIRASNVTFQKGEVDALPLEDGSTDAVFFSMVLHHVPEIAAALAEARRVLRPGGRVVIADLAPHENEAMRERMGDLRLGLDPNDLMKLLNDGGFDRVRRLPVHDRLVAGRHINLELVLVTGEHRATSRRRTKRKARRET